jgi:hypothetical protein
MLLVFEYITLNFETDPLALFDAVYADFECYVLPTYKYAYIKLITMLLIKLIIFLFLFQKKCLVFFII